MGRLKLSNKLVTVLFCVLPCLPGPILADEPVWSRRGKLEVFGIFQPISGDKTSTEQGIEVEFKGANTFGVGIGYNIIDLVNLNASILWGNTDLETDAPGWSYQTNGDSDLYFMDFNVDVNFMKRRITPVISAGIGNAGFVGYALGADLQESSLSWNMGGGVRWDAMDHLLIKALYRATWTKLEDSNDDLVFSGLALSVGYMF
jgi:opacity protein-like surface antigen